MKNALIGKSFKNENIKWPKEIPFYIILSLISAEFKQELNV